MRIELVAIIKPLRVGVDRSYVYGDRLFCPLCGRVLDSGDPFAQRYEHDMKYHPEYWIYQTGSTYV